MQRLLLCLAALPLTATAAAAQGTFDIRVDPRVELVSTVFTLMGSRDGWSERPLDSSYRARMHRRFSPFRNHPAIPAAAATRFGYNYPAEAILHFGPPPALEPRVRLRRQPSSQRAGSTRSTRGSPGFATLHAMPTSCAGSRRSSTRTMP
jgi:hypothetical protein